jgi:hypothetical protein
MANAVCVFCDDNYFPVADILCRQLAAEEGRNFDVVLFLESKQAEAPAGNRPFDPVHDPDFARRL